MNSSLLSTASNPAKRSMETIKTVTFYSHSKDNDALGYLRLLGPARRLGIEVIEGMEDDQIFVERAFEGDVIVLQRDFPSHLTEYEKILSIAHKEGKPVILDLDDLLLELPQNHPERKSHYYAQALLPILRAIMEADLVTVATPRLRDYVLPINKNVVVLPNYLNDDLWELRKPSVSAEEEPLIIGYMGGLSHQPDLDMVTPALLHINSQYPGKLQFNFWGIRPPAELAAVSQVRWYHPDTRRYPDFAAYFQTQAADIFIGPLYDSLFNFCKSPIKYFEYSALGAPGIFSRVGPYSDVITDGYDGMLASSFEEWIECLTRLIEDPSLRLEVATNAQKSIKSNWLLSGNASRWLDTYQKAFVNLSLKASDSSSFPGLVKSLSNQIREDQEDKSHQINVLKARLQTLAPLVTELGIFRPYVKAKVYRRIKKDLALIRSSGLFDEKWYLASYSDVARARVDPWLHFLTHGGFERRDPSPHFSSGWYLDAYEDVKLSGINPLIHFLKFGLAEGRLAHSEETVQELSAHVILKRIHPIRAFFIPYGSRREKLLLRLKNFFFMPLGIFNESRMFKIRYILKNDGAYGLIQAIAASLKARFWDNIVKTVDAGKQRLKLLVKAKTQKISTRQVDRSVQARLGEFLRSGAVVELPVYGEPVVSIGLLFHNRAEMSLQCLQSLVAGAGQVPFEVIIVDNASTDNTSALLERIRNARILRNPANLGFGGGYNQVAELAVGKYLFLLNNDTQLLPDSLQVLVDTLESDPTIGAVGGKLIFPDGRLQEAGSIIWRDGSCLGYGRFDDPFKGEYCYVRDVDFCSAALLLTPRQLFLDLGGFDARYAPAYYEDADYCMQLWTKGYRVVFQPFAAAIHHEFGSSGSERALPLQREHRRIFVDKWSEQLERFELPEPAHIITAREHRSDAKRILFIDDRIPDTRLGSGYPRTYRMLEMLAEMGYRITFFPMQISAYIPDIARALQLRGIEVLYAKTEREDPEQKINFEEFMASRPDYYDVIFLSRPHNMQEALQPLKTYARSTPIVYDAEALFSLRDIKFRELNGERVSKAEKERLVRDEVALVKAAGTVITVSELEKEQFVKHGTASVHVLGHILEPHPTPAPFEQRQDILFVSSIMTDPSPNSDAVRYFATQILPLVRQEIDCQFYVVGTNRIKAIWNLESEFVHIVGKVEDLTPYYNRSRLFVVPTRYSAGIPLKLLEASAHGLPAVVTPLTASQLGWRIDHDLLVGYDPEDFARKVIDLYTSQHLFETLRQNALQRIHLEYSPAYFRSTLEYILSLAINRRNRQKHAIISSQTFSI